MYVMPTPDPELVARLKELKAEDRRQTLEDRARRMKESGGKTGGWCKGSSPGANQGGAHWIKQTCTACGKKVEVGSGGRTVKHKPPKAKENRRRMMDELIEELTENIREAIDMPMPQADALEVVEGVISNLEAVAAGLRSDIATSG